MQSLMTSTSAPTCRDTQNTLTVGPTDAGEDRTGFPKRDCFREVDLLILLLDSLINVPAFKPKTNVQRMWGRPVRRGSHRTGI